jgi:hypothetical protein
MCVALIVNEYVIYFGIDSVPEMCILMFVGLDCVFLDFVVQHFKERNMINSSVCLSTNIKLVGLIDVVNFSVHI